jgi:phosphoribosyl 1,2-cyclic phosphodiesterase
MSLELCILASGSGGNCSALRSPNGTLLIDAGIGPRTFAKRAAGTGLTLDSVRAVCLTHLDHDHFSLRWVRTLVAKQIRVYCDGRRIDELMRSVFGPPELVQAFEALLVPFDASQAFSPIDGVQMHSIPLAHDQMGSHGFVIEGFGVRIGYATDLGRVPQRLIDRFCDLDMLAIESNYDPQMQMGSTRPWYLKNRIMGGSGHLSNAQALQAIRMILDRCEQRATRMPAHIVLLHRSRECNCPDLLRKLFCEDPRIAKRLTLAEQFDRTDWLRPINVQASVGQQLALQFDIV